MSAPDPTPEHRTGGHVALTFVQVCFGLFPLFGIWATRPEEGVSGGVFVPLAVASWRMGFGALVLLALALWAHGREALPARRDLPLFALCALLGVVLNQVLFLVGLPRSTATNAGLVMCLIPVFTFAIATLARQEAFRPLRGLGLAIALFGATMLFWGQEPEFRAAYGFGNLLMALNALSYSIYLVVSRPLARRYPPLVTIAWVYVLSLAALPFTVLVVKTGGHDIVPADASPRAWASLAYVLIFPTTLAYLLNVFALSRLRASTTAVYIYMQPLIAGTAGWLFLNEQPTGGLVLAAVLIFAGIWLVARRPATASSSARDAGAAPLPPEVSPADADRA